MIDNLKADPENPNGSFQRLAEKVGRILMNEEDV